MAPTRGRPLFNCFRTQVHACTRCLQSKLAPFQQPFMEANVKGGHGPLAGSDGPGCDAAAWHVSGPPDSKPVSCTSYIYCHCHDSGTLMSLNFSNFSLPSSNNEILKSFSLEKLSISKEILTSSLIRSPISVL